MFLNLWLCTLIWNHFHRKLKNRIIFVELSQKLRCVFNKPNKQIAICSLKIKRKFAHFLIRH